MEFLFIYNGPEGQGNGSVTLAEKPSIGDELAAVKVQIGQLTLPISIARVTAVDHVGNRIFLGSSEES